MTGTTDAILMASGISRRFGKNDKLLAPFDGVPLARRALETFCALRRHFGTIYFVCSSPAVAALAQGLPVVALHNPNPQEGPSLSVRLGVTASGAANYLFCPCDQPFLDEATITTILSSHAAGGITYPVFGGKPGNPTVFSSNFRDALLALEPGQPARVIKNRHPEALRPVALDEEKPLLDIDTEEDYRRLLAMLLP